MLIRSGGAADVAPLAHAFGDWPKPRELFERYAEMAGTGDRDLVVAFAHESDPIGYLTIAWVSEYRPFAAAGIPEIVDFNVLAPHRRAGVGTALMDEAERRIATRSPIAGIGVGLYRDYGAAQRLYVKRGYVPDGAGVIVEGAAPEPGSTIVLDDSPALMFTKSVR